MPRYGRSSRGKLETCTDGLKRIFYSVIKAFDNSILEGRRSLERQKELLKAGATTTLNSKHIPPEPDGLSEALDAAPYPIKWPNTDAIKRVHEQINNDAELKKYIKDLARFYAFGGFVKGVAHEQGVKIRWGADWDGDWDFTDQTFDDLVHFEKED
jgi:peptidoglycan L-alanyl-D-glutamate endopeptidase CwlK